MEEILNKIVKKIESLVDTYPSHLIDESLIKHKIIEILIDEIENPFNIKILQAEKTCKISGVTRCDIFFRHNNKNVFLELKLNRLVLKLNASELSGSNQFSGDVLAILKDLDEMRVINNGEKYLFLLMQNRGVKIGNRYNLSLNEYCKKKQTNDSKRLMEFIENNDKNSEVIIDKIIPGKVNNIEVPFRMLIFKVK